MPLIFALRHDTLEGVNGGVPVNDHAIGLNAWFWVLAAMCCWMARPEAPFSKT